MCHLCVDKGLYCCAMKGGERERGFSAGDKMTQIAVKTKRDLTDRQRRLVEAYVSNGGNLTKAAHEAGYAEGNSGRVSAYKAMKTAHVRMYLMEAMSEAFGLSAAKALGRVVQLSGGAKSEYVQLEASKDLLDRAGFKPIDRSQVQVAGDIKVSIDLS